MNAEWTGFTRSGVREAEIECLARNIGRVVWANDLKYTQQWKGVDDQRV